MGNSSSQHAFTLVPKVDVPRFMGKWFVIASIPTYFEKGAYNAVETYTWVESDKHIDVDFRFRQNAFTGPEKTIPQKAFVHGQNGAEWRVQPFWPVKLPYLIIELADDYSYTVIGYPSRAYLWIMAREPTLSPEIYSGLVEKVKSKHGYDISKIVKVPQQWP